MTAKVTPSTSRRGRTAWPGSTNCGRNVTKKTPSFGLLIAERNPCRKTAWAGAAGGAPARRSAGRCRDSKRVRSEGLSGMDEATNLDGDSTVLDVRGRDMHHTRVGVTQSAGVE